MNTNAQRASHIAALAAEIIEKDARVAELEAALDLIADSEISERQAEYLRGIARAALAKS